MSPAETLRMLAAGQRPTAGLLHTLRSSAFGVEAYGEEAVVESFRHHALTFSDKRVDVEAPGHLAVFDDENALIADIAGKNIARLWRLGCGEPLPAEARISVAFDPDLTQARGDLFLAASDHPSLAADAVNRAMEAGRAITRDSDNRYRARAYVIRAFGTAAAGVALFAVYRLDGQPGRTSGFAMAAARWSSGEMHIVRDRVGEAAATLHPWTPRIGD